MKNELRMHRLVGAVPSLVLIAAIGWFTTARVEAVAPQPSHQDVQNSVGAVQTTVNGIGTKVDNIGSTVEQLPLAWSRILPAAQRFQLVMGGAAVLDKETGLVWEQSPSEERDDWFWAQVHCNVSAVGGRKGWRLPTVQELASLIDPTRAVPALPAGHAFSNVQLALSWYWSATTNAGDLGFGPVGSLAWGVSFIYGDLMFGTQVNANHVWCVRGGQGANPQ